MATIQDPVVEKLFGLLPTPGGNNSGKPARAALVSKLKGSTPGRHTKAFGKKGDTFLKIFFPNYKAAPYEEDTSLTKLDKNWWADFSVAVLCQGMYNLTKDLRKQLKRDDINNAVKSKNSELKTHCMAFYAKVFRDTFAKAQYNSIKNKTSAKAQYKAALTSDAWIMAKRTEASEGMWTDAAWELYHHWVKLHLLGASNVEIDGVIKQLSSKELMIPPEVGAGKWTSYTAWMNPAAITWKDIQGDAAKGILKSERMPSYSPDGGSSSMKEENSFEFTAKGQPGHGYRHTGGGGGSCFTGDTKVLMANGALLPIRSVEVGDEVFTLQGPRRVAVISTPTRKQRHLFSINGHSFRFTETHPFVTPAGLGGGMDIHGAAFAAVSPSKLANLVPTLSRLGIVKMEPGLTVMSLQNEQLHPTPVHLIEEHPLKKPESEDDLLYDLILEPTEAGFPHYVVGDDSILVLVASEVPRVELAPFAAITILKALQEAADHIEAQPVPVNRGEPPSGVPHVFHVLSPTKAIVSNVNAMAVNSKTCARQAESCDVSDMLSVFVKEDTASGQTSYRRELGDAYEQMAALHGEEIDAIVDLGFRSIGQEEDDASQLLSVSLLDVIFHDLPKHSPGKRLAVDIEARTRERTDKVWCEESSEKISSNFARHFRQVFYFPDVDIDDGCVTDIHFQVHDADDSHPLPYSASVVVPWKLEHNYRMFEAILHDEDDQEIGLLRFDVRILSSNAMQEEQRRSETWEDADKQAYALALGKCYGEHMKVQLPNVLSHGLVAVTKRPWFKRSCFSM